MHLKWFFGHLYIIQVAPPREICHFVKPPVYLMCLKTFNDFHFNENRGKDRNLLGNFFPYNDIYLLYEGIRNASLLKTQNS